MANVEVIVLDEHRVERTKLYRLLLLVAYTVTESQYTDKQSEIRNLAP